MRIHSKIGLEKVIRNDGTFGVKLTELNSKFITNSILDISKKFNQEKIHSIGAPRIYTTMKINTRTDKEQKFSDKVKSVLEN